jgi:hypothetical protein
LLGGAAFPWIVAGLVPFRASVPLSSFLPAVGKQRVYQLIEVVSPYFFVRLLGYLGAELIN